MGFTTTSKNGKQSATKWGALLIGVSFLFATVGSVLSGSLTLVDAIPKLLTEVGGVFAAWGLRDVPLFN